LEPTDQELLAEIGSGSDLAGGGNITVVEDT
jgi:hypothetical protein